MNRPAGAHAAASDPPGATRGGFGAPLVVFAAALALRLALLFAGDDSGWPHSLRFEGDAPVWARWARALSAGQPFEFDLPVRTPGVAFALYGLGFDRAPFTGAKLLWCVLSALTCAVLWTFVARRFSRRAAWIAAGWLAISNAALQLATSLNGEALYALLVVLLLGAGLAQRRAAPSWRTAALGAGHGVALLLRAEHLLLVALLAALDSYEARREPAALRLVAARWAVALLALLAVCAPWIWRSHAAVARFNRVAPPIPYERLSPPWTPAARTEIERLPAFAREGNAAFLSHLARQASRAQVDGADVREFFEREWGYTPEPLGEWTLVSSKGALDFALANHPDSDGGFSRAALRDGRDAEPEFAFGRPTHLRLYLHGYSIGLASIAEDPARWLALVGRKLERFGAGVASGVGANDWPHGSGAVRRAVDLSTAGRPSWAWNAAILGLIAAGAWLARRGAAGRALTAVVLYKLAVTLAFYGYARQAASIGPVTCALGAVALDELVARAEGRWGTPARRAAWGLAAAVVAAATWGALRPVSWAPEAGAVGVRAAPEWGSGAFESPLDMRLAPAAPR